MNLLPLDVITAAEMMNAKQVMDPLPALRVMRVNWNISLMSFESLLKI